MKDDFEKWHKQYIDGCVLPIIYSEDDVKASFLAGMKVQKQKDIEIVSTFEQKCCGDEGTMAGCILEAIKKGVS